MIVDIGAAHQGPPNKNMISQSNEQKMNLSNVNRNASCRDVAGATHTKLRVGDENGILNFFKRNRPKAEMLLSSIPLAQQPHHFLFWERKPPLIFKVCSRQATTKTAEFLRLLDHCGLPPFSFSTIY